MTSRARYKLWNVDCHQYIKVDCQTLWYLNKSVCMYAVSVVLKREMGQSLITVEFTWMMKAEEIIN